MTVAMYLGPMALLQSAVSDLPEVLRTGEAVDLIRESVRTVLQELIETEAADRRRSAAAEPGATTVAAGGRLLDESEDRWRVADPEGNEMVIVSGA